MNKETSHRSPELKKLGWNQEDITRYEELWDYSQRWGLINLEKEDRQFLRKAEKLLPKIQPKKIKVIFFIILPPLINFLVLLL